MTYLSDPSALHIFGIPLDTETPDTHGPCQVRGCEYEWTISTTIERYDARRPQRSVCLCGKHSKLFRDVTDNTPSSAIDSFASELIAAHRADIVADLKAALDEVNR